MRSRMQFAAYPEDRVPEGLRAALAAPRPMYAEEPRAPLAPVARRTSSRRRRHDVCEMRLVGSGALRSSPAPAMAASGVSVAAANGVDGPLMIGFALLVCPPVGVTLLWASARFSYGAKVAVTCFAAFHAMLIAVVVIAMAR